MKNASFGGRPLNRTSWIEVLPHLHKRISRRGVEQRVASYFRNPVSRIFVRMTSATGVVELELVAAVSIQSSSVARNELPVLQRPTSRTCCNV